MHTISIQVVGYIWQPGTGLCATDYSARCNDLLNRFDRETVQDWLDCHAGDFSEVVDFRATHGPEEIPWADDENDMHYWDCMDPMPAEEYC